MKLQPVNPEWCLKDKQETLLLDLPMVGSHGYSDLAFLLSYKQEKPKEHKLSFGLVRRSNWF